MDIPKFRYMDWAKAHNGRGEFRLHASGIPAVGLADLGLSPDAVRLSRPVRPTPDPEVAEAVAARYRVPVDCVMPTCGTHHANFLAARALAGPGVRVLCEEPYYEAVPGVFRAVGAEVTHFRRHRKESWRLPLPEIRRGLEGGAKVVCLTDLHNPSGARLLPDDLAGLEAAARDHAATVLVDEVYRDFLPPPVGTAFFPGGPFVATTSLTKVYGLGDLRFGWALASPDLVRRMFDLNNFVLVNLPAPSASVAMAAWGNLDAVASRHRDIAARNLRVLSDWVRGRNDVRWRPPDGGISALLEIPALAGKDDVAWVERLFEERDLGVVPGTMFGAPGGIRVSFGMATDTLREGLRRLGEALDGLGPTAPATPPARRP